MKRKHQIKFAQHGGTARIIAFLLLRLWVMLSAILVAMGTFVFLPATLFAQHEAKAAGGVMGMGANVGQVLGMMKEFIRPNLPKLYINEHFLIHKIGGPKPGMPKVATGANARPYRVPLELLAGFKGFTGQPDGGSLQRGSGPTTDAGTLVPVYIYQAGE